MVCSISLKESSGILALNINTDVWKIKNERKIVTNICDGECLRSGILSDHQHHLEWLALLSVRRVEVVGVVVAWWWCVWRGWVHFDPLSSAGVEYKFYYIGQWVARRWCWSRGHGCCCCWWQIHRRIHKVHVWLKIVIWKREKETKKKEKKKKKHLKGIHSIQSIRFSRYPASWPFWSVDRFKRRDPTLAPQHFQIFHNHTFN